MIWAASLILVLVVRAGRMVATAPAQTSLMSFPSAMAWAMSVSVMMPTGWPVWASATRRAAVPACFIRYAAAARWSCWPTVASGGCMMSATVTVAGCGRNGDFGGAFVVMVCFISGLLTCGVAVA